MRFKLTIEYAGTRYSGWQIQKNAKTVQGEIERAITAATSERDFELYGSGRTDAGVHALGQVAHVDLPSAIPPATLVERVNNALPADINVLDAERMPPRFHARHSAVARSYLYQIARRRTAFAKPYVWWVRDPLDLDRMRDAAIALTKFADFRAFTDDDPEEKSTTVLVHGITVGEHGHLGGGRERGETVARRAGSPLHHGFDQGVPGAAARAFALPLGRGAAAFGAAVSRLVLGHVRTTIASPEAFRRRTWQQPPKHLTC